VSIIAGVFVLDGGQPLTDAERRAFVASLCRTPPAAIHQTDTAGHLLAAADVGVAGDPAWLRQADRTCALVGQPYLPPAAADSALRDAARMDANEDSAHVFARARGSFAGAVLDAAGERALLVTDRLGVRPLYWTLQKGRLAFASALRILLAQPWLDATPDAASLLLRHGTGICVGDTTVYREIRRLRGGEALLLDRAQAPRPIRYWRWDMVDDTTLPAASALDALHACFEEAVSLRLGSRKQAIAFLSGGLDSRMVVTSLAARGLDLSTITLEQPGSLDARIARDYATHLQLPHDSFVTRDRLTGRMPFVGATEVGRHTSLQAVFERNRRTLWAGDGGSICCGYVHSTAERVARLRAGGVAAAVAILHEIRRFVPHSRMIRAQLRDAAAQEAEARIHDAFAALEPADSGRLLQLYFLENQEPAQLAPMYENIDLWRVDLDAPFFDADLIAAFQSFPIDVCLRHGLYMDWMDRFGPAPKQVPWQAYPGHIESALPLPAGAYQWRPHDAAERRETLAQARASERDGRALANADPVFIDPSYAMAARLGGALGLTRMAHHLDFLALARSVAGRRADRL